MLITKVTGKVLRLLSFEYCYSVFLIITNVNVNEKQRFSLGGFFDLGA